MIAVIFEVTPKEAGIDSYFQIAQQLKESLHKIDGFISVERFQSLTDTQKFLSLSFWENETAIQQWKSHFEHQTAQQKGKNELFSSFRIRVGNIVRDYGAEYANDQPASDKPKAS